MESESSESQEHEPLLIDYVDLMSPEDKKVRDDASNIIKLKFKNEQMDIKKVFRREAKIQKQREL